LKYMRLFRAGSANAGRRDVNTAFLIIRFRVAATQILI